MTKVNFKRYSTKNEALAEEIVDGSFIVTKDGANYVDFGEERVPIGGTPDTEMSDTSENPVQNKIIKQYADTIADTKIDKNSIKNEKTESDDNVYGCNYINKFDDIGKVVNLFGNVMGTDGSETISCYAHVVATKINETDWKFEIEGQMDIQNPTNNFLWGFDIPKISNLLNSAIGVQVEFNENLKTLGNWNIIKLSNSLPYLEYYNYGTTFEHNSNYLLPARYYNLSGAIGGYSTSSFEASTHVYATIYLKEV